MPPRDATPTRARSRAARRAWHTRGRHGARTGARERSRVDAGRGCQCIDRVGAIRRCANEIGLRLRDGNVGAHHVEMWSSAVARANVGNGAVAQRAFERIAPRAFERDRLKGVKIQLCGALLGSQRSRLGIALRRDQIARRRSRLRGGREDIVDGDAYRNGEHMLFRDALVEGSCLRRERVCPRKVRHAAGASDFQRRLTLPHVGPRDLHVDVLRDARASASLTESCENAGNRGQSIASRSCGTRCPQSRVQHRNEQQREERRRREAADDRDGQRLFHRRSGADAEGQRQQSADRRKRRHQNRPQPFAPGKYQCARTTLRPSLRRRFAASSSRMPFFTTRPTSSSMPMKDER